MRRWLPLVLLAACASENRSLVVERQASPVAQATDAGWKRGSVILSGEPGTFTFPQPIALRLTIVDDDTAEMPKYLAISMGTVDPFGAGAVEVSVAPDCQPMRCFAELRVTAAGSSMVAIEATGPKGIERQCFYYAVVDSGTDTDALRTSLEEQQRDCRFQ